MTNKEIEMGMSLKDDATVVWDEFEQTVRDGTKRVGQYSGEMDKLTKFIREERQESRMQNFLFRESKQVIEGLAFATIALSVGNDKAEASTRRFTDSLITGFATYQTTAFSLSAIAMAFGKTLGPWGAIISGVVGAGSALISFLKSAQDETKKLVEIHKEEAKVLEEIVGQYGNWMSKMKGDSAAVIAVSKEEQKLMEARLAILSQMINGEKNATIVIDERGKTSAEVAAMEQMGNWAVGKSAEELQQQYKELQVRLEAVKAAALGLTIVAPKMPASPISPKLAVFDDWKAAIQLFKSGEDGTSIEMPLIKDLKEVSFDIPDAFDENWRLALNEVSQLSSRMSNDFYNFFAGNVQGVNALMKDLTSSIAEQFGQLMADLAAKAALSGILSLIFPQIGFGGFMGSFGGIGGKIFAPSENSSGKSTSSARIPGTPSAPERSTIIFNNYAPMTSQEAVLQTLGDVVRGTGQTIDKIIVNNRAKVSLAT